MNGKSFMIQGSTDNLVRNTSMSMSRDDIRKKDSKSRILGQKKTSEIVRNHHKYDIDVCDPEQTDPFRKSLNNVQRTSGIARNFAQANAQNAMRVMNSQQSNRRRMMQHSENPRQSNQLNVQQQNDNRANSLNPISNQSRRQKNLPYDAEQHNVFGNHMNSPSQLKAGIQNNSHLPGQIMNHIQGHLQIRQNQNTSQFDKTDKWFRKRNSSKNDSFSVSPAHQKQIKAQDLNTMAIIGQNQSQPDLNKSFNLSNYTKPVASRLMNQQQGKQIKVKKSNLISGITQEQFQKAQQLNQLLNSKQTRNRESCNYSVMEPHYPNQIASENGALHHIVNNRRQSIMRKSPSQKNQPTSKDRDLISDKSDECIIENSRSIDKSSKKLVNSKFRMVKISKQQNTDQTSQSNSPDVRRSQIQQPWKLTDLIDLGTDPMSSKQSIMRDKESSNEYLRVKYGGMGHIPVKDNILVQSQGQIKKSLMIENQIDQARAEAQEKHANAQAFVKSQKNKTQELFRQSDKNGIYERVVNQPSSPISKKYGITQAQKLQDQQWIERQILANRNQVNSDLQKSQIHSATLSPKGQKALLEAQLIPINRNREKLKKSKPNQGNKVESDIEAINQNDKADQIITFADFVSRKPQGVVFTHANQHQNDTKFNLKPQQQNYEEIRSTVGSQITFEFDKLRQKSNQSSQGQRTSKLTKKHGLAGEDEILRNTQFIPPQQKVSNPMSQKQSQAKISKLQKELSRLVQDQAGSPKLDANNKPQPIYQQLYQIPGQFNPNLNRRGQFPQKLDIAQKSRDQQALQQFRVRNYANTVKVDKGSSLINHLNGGTQSSTAGGISVNSVKAPNSPMNIISKSPIADKSDYASKKQSRPRNTSIESHTSNSSVAKVDQQHSFGGAILINDVIADQKDSKQTRGQTNDSQLKERKPKVVKNTSRINMHISSDQGSRGQKNVSNSKERQTAGQTSNRNELSAILGVSQAQIFTKQQIQRDDPVVVYQQNNNSDADDKNASPQKKFHPIELERRTKTSIQKANAEKQAHINQQSDFQGYSSDPYSTNSKGLLSNENTQIIKIQKLVAGKPQMEQDKYSNTQGQIENMFYKTAYIGQRSQNPSDQINPNRGSTEYFVYEQNQVIAQLLQQQIQASPNQDKTQKVAKALDLKQLEEQSTQYLQKIKEQNASVQLADLVNQQFKAQEETSKPEILNLNPDKLVYCVTQGNNSELIKYAMRHSPKRKYKWQELSADVIATYGAPCHFKWQPVSKGLKFSQMSNFNAGTGHSESRSIYNHWEQHSWLSEKSRLFEILTQYSTNKLKENVFNYLPVTFYVESYSLSAAPHANKAMTQFINSFYALEDIKKRTTKFFEQRTKKQIQDEICDDEMSQGANEEGQSSQPQELYTQLADSFIFKYFYSNKLSLIKQHKKEAREELQAHQQLLSINEEVGSGPKMLKKHIFKLTMPLCHFSGYNLWLLKPTRLNRGRGIHVINNLTYLRQLIHQYCEGFSHKSKLLPEAVKSDYQPPRDKFQEGPSARGEILRKFEPVRTPNKKASRLNMSKVDKLNQNEEYSSPGRKHPDQATFESQMSSTHGTNNFGFGGTGGGGASTGTMKHNSFIFQKYIERPLLIKGRKFDIRCWVLWNYDSKVYLFKEGYLRTSSQVYKIDPENPDDMFTHLTNNAVQKTSKDYGAFEDGNQISYAAFQSYCLTQTESKRLRKFSVKDNFIPTIKKQIARTIFATKDLIDPMKRKHCFELFGYDFIIDEDLNTWMIEVNTNPCLEESSSILAMYLPRLVEDMLSLSVDQLFKQFKGDIESNGEGDQKNQSPKKKGKPYKYPSVDGYDDEENLWELLVDLKDQKSRSEAKAKYLTPIELHSSHAFQLKDRGFKIKKYESTQNWTTYKETMNAKEGRGIETNIETQKEMEKINKSVGSMSEQFVEEEDDSGMAGNLEEEEEI